MKVTLLLCDFAQAVQGKLYVLGGGWSIKGANSPMAIALKIEVPWSEANRRHRWALELRDAEGQGVEVNTPEGKQPVRLEGQLEVGRPAGLPEGTPLDSATAINMGPMPLEPGSRYEWRLSINDHSEPDWYLSFLVRGHGPEGEQ